MSEAGDFLVVFGALAFVISLARSHRIGVVMALVWGTLAFFPPWIYPALSVVVLLAVPYAVGPERGARLAAERQQASPDVAPDLL